jgi:hypothetical protein
MYLILYMLRAVVLHIKLLPVIIVIIIIITFIIVQ